jgi:hypothetical protein
MKYDQAELSRLYTMRDEKSDTQVGQDRDYMH